MNGRQLSKCPMQLVDVRNVSEICLEGLPTERRLHPNCHHKADSQLPAHSQPFGGKEIDAVTADLI